MVILRVPSSSSTLCLYFTSLCYSYLFILPPARLCYITESLLHEAAGVIRYDMQGDDLRDRYRHPHLPRTYLQLVTPLLVAILPLLDTTCRQNMRLPHPAKIATLSEIDRWLTHDCMANVLTPCLRLNGVAFTVSTCEAKDGRGCSVTCHSNHASRLSRCCGGDESPAFEARLTMTPGIRLGRKRIVGVNNLFL